MTDKTFTVNSVNLAPFVERDSYNTRKEPVYSDTITTMDGVDHCVPLRSRNILSVSFNPVTQAEAVTIITALMSLPASVTFTSLQTGQSETASMILSETEINFLSRCLSAGQSWVSIGEIELTEL